MKKLLIYLAASGIVLLSSCNQESLSGDEYVSYVENEENGLLNSKEMDGLIFMMQYCPDEYSLLKEKKTEPGKAELDERKKENDSILFFRLRVKTTDNSDVINYKLHSNDEYYARIQYLSYGFEQNIVLIHNNDTIYPALFHFERTYGVAPYADVMIAFDAGLKKDDDFQVVVDDQVFNTGLLKFSFRNKDIQTIPQLKTN